MGKIKAPCEYLIAVDEQRKMKQRVALKDIYGETENKGLFLLTPEWLQRFELEAGYIDRRIKKRNNRY